MAQTPPKPLRPPFVLGPEDIAILSGYLGVNLVSPDQLTRRVRDLVKLSVEGVQVVFKPGVLERLKTRAMGNELGPWLADRVREWANNYVGL